MRHCVAAASLVIPGIMMVGGGGEIGGTAGVNFGGGMTYWFKENRGIRGEYRAHSLIDTYALNHEIRFGFVWKR